MSDEVGDRININSCVKALRSHYNLDDNYEFFFKFLQLSSNFNFSYESNPKKLRVSIDPIAELTIYGPEGLVDTRNLCNRNEVDFKFKVNLSKSLNLTELHYFHEQEINIFDINDPFFNDICSSYVIGDNDITLQHRRDLFYKNNSQICTETPEQVCKIYEYDLNGVVSCNCVGLRGEEPQSNELGYWQENNLSIFRCVKEAFEGNPFRNIGFNICFSIISILTTWAIINMFLIKSTIYSTLKFRFLRNDMLFFDESTMTLSFYFIQATKQLNELPDEQALINNFEKTNRKSVTTFVDVDIEAADERGEATARNSAHENDSHHKPSLKIEGEEDASSVRNREIEELKKNLDKTFGILSTDKKFVLPTMKDYDELEPEDQIKFDKRTFCEYIEDNIYRYHTYFYSMFYVSITTPKFIRIFILLSVLSWQVFVNAIMMFQSLIRKRADTDSDTVNY